MKSKKSQASKLALEPDTDGTMRSSKRGAKKSPAKSAMGFTPTTDAELDALSRALDKTLATDSPFTPPSSPLGDAATSADGAIDAEHARRVIILDWDE